MEPTEEAGPPEVAEVRFDARVSVLVASPRPLPNKAIAGEGAAAGATTTEAYQRAHRGRGPGVKAAKAHSSEGNDALLDEATARQANTRSERNDAGRKAEGGSRMQQR